MRNERRSVICDNHANGNMKIAVAGIGYVGLSNAILLAQHNQVTAVDVFQEKADMINNRKSPIIDAEIEEYLATKELNLKATTDGAEAYKDAEYIIIATPTNYDPDKNYFDTSSIESVIETVLKVNKDTVMVIKSTIPVGYTHNIENIGEGEMVLIMWCNELFDKEKPDTYFKPVSE